MTCKSSLGASKIRFKAFGPPFARLLDALGRILDAFGTLLAVSLASLGPLGRFWKHLKCIWERFGSYMESIWDPFARFLRHILIKEPPRCLASRRGASQFNVILHIGVWPFRQAFEMSCWQLTYSKQTPLLMFLKAANLNADVQIYCAFASILPST